MNKHPLSLLTSFILLTIMAACTSTAKVDSPKAIVEKDVPHEILGLWEPLSRLFLDHGNIRISSNHLYWDTGEELPYEVVSTGYQVALIRMPHGPPFYDEKIQYIQLKRVPNRDIAEWEDLQISYFKDLNAAQMNHFSIWGVYVRERGGGPIRPLY